MTASPGRLRALFDAQIRIPANEEIRPGWVRDIGPGQTRRFYPDPADESSTAYIESPLGLSDARPQIARNRDFFAERGQPVEWKTYDYDEPADLTDLLTEAGFAGEDPEGLLLGAADDLAAAPGDLAPGYRLAELTTNDDFVAMGVCLESVWDPTFEAPGRLPDTPPGPAAKIQTEYRANPDAIQCVGVFGPDDAMVCAAWVRFHSGSEFASFWGGATLPDHRRRGAYAETVRARARAARNRGYRYIRVDTSPDSRPILRRFGLHQVAMTTPYVYRP